MFTDLLRTNLQRMKVSVNSKLALFSHATTISTTTDTKGYPNKKEVRFMTTTTSGGDDTTTITAAVTTTPDSTPGVSQEEIPAVAAESELTPTEDDYDDYDDETRSNTNKGVHHQRQPQRLRYYHGLHHDPAFNRSRRCRCESPEAVETVSNCGRVMVARNGRLTIPRERVYGDHCIQVLRRTINSANLVGGGAGGPGTKFVSSYDDDGTCVLSPPPPPSRGGGVSSSIPFASVEDFHCKALCLAVSSCAQDLLPLYHVRIGMVAPRTTMDPPGWKDTILTLGTLENPLGVVDFDFQNKFRIARPTPDYERLLLCLPKIFVGTMQELASVLTEITDAAAESSLQQGLVPAPWRNKRSYLLLYRHCFEDRDGSAERSVALLDRVSAAAAKIFQLPQDARRQPPPHWKQAGAAAGVNVEAQAAQIRFLLHCVDPELRRNYHYHREMRNCGSNSGGSSSSTALPSVLPHHSMSPSFHHQPKGAVMVMASYSSFDEELFDKVEVISPQGEDSTNVGFAPSNLTLALRLQQLQYQ